jgi:uncharacterized protein
VDKIIVTCQRFSPLTIHHSRCSSKLLIYIHGLNSSARSAKAALLRARMLALGREADYACPDLPHRPRRALETLEALILGARGAVALVGSSLGGYYATCLVERHDLKAVLVNPAVRPYEGLRDLLGLQQNLYTGARYELTQAHLDELADMEVAAITRPERYLLMVQTGDEVLDYRQAVERYRGCRQLVIEGGDHGFSDFADYLGPVLEFCGLTPAKS